MLDNGWGRDFAGFPKLVRRKDVDLTNHIAVRLKPTRRAAVIAPLWFVSIPAGWTSLGGVALILQDNCDPFGLRFVLYEFSDLTMIPTTDFLVGLLAQINAVGNIFDVAQHDSACAPSEGFIHDRATNLMFHIVGNPIMLGLHSGLGTHQLFIAATAFLFLGKVGAQLCQPLGVALLFVLLSLGLNIVVGYAGLLDLGYIAFFAIGAYLAGLLASPQFAVIIESLQMEYPAAGDWLLQVAGDAVAAQGIHWSVWLIIPLAALVAGIFGALLGAPTLKLRNRRACNASCSSLPQPLAWHSSEMTVFSGAATAV